MDENDVMGEVKNISNLILIKRSFSMLSNGAHILLV
jgi:hypothetical protein